MAQRVDINCTLEPYRRDSTFSIGYLTAFRGLDMGEYFKADLSLPDPTKGSPDVKEQVAGLIERVTWGGGPSDLIIISAYISDANLRELETKLHGSFRTTEVSFAFTIYQYDPLAKWYFSAFGSDPATQLVGELNTSTRSKVWISIDPQPALIDDRTLRKFAVEIAPSRTHPNQRLIIGPSATKVLKQPWGLAGPVVQVAAQTS